ncbi:MAG: hypothetical protein P1U74_07005 [Legionellaceae bacterium]|nr:hypothetical protein [Legionellaceae bacterium]
MFNKREEPVMICCKDSSIGGVVSGGIGDFLASDNEKTAQARMDRKTTDITSTKIPAATSLTFVGHSSQNMLSSGRRVSGQSGTQLAKLIALKFQGKKKDLKHFYFLSCEAGLGDKSIAKEFAEQMEKEGFINLKVHAFIPQDPSIVSMIVSTSPNPYPGSELASSWGYRSEVDEREDMRIQKDINRLSKNHDNIFASKSKEAMKARQQYKDSNPQADGKKLHEISDTKYDDLTKECDNLKKEIYRLRKSQEVLRVPIAKEESYIKALNRPENIVHTSGSKKANESSHQESPQARNGEIAPSVGVKPSVVAEFIKFIRDFFLICRGNSPQDLQDRLKPLEIGLKKDMELNQNKSNSVEQIRTNLQDKIKVRNFQNVGKEINTLQVKLKDKENELGSLKPSRKALFARIMNSQPDEETIEKITKIQTDIDELQKKIALLSDERYHLRDLDTYKNLFEKYLSEDSPKFIDKALELGLVSDDEYKNYCVNQSSIRINRKQMETSLTGVKTYLSGKISDYIDELDKLDSEVSTVKVKKEGLEVMKIYLDANTKEDRQAAKAALDAFIKNPEKQEWNSEYVSQFKLIKIQVEAVQEADKEVPEAEEDNSRKFSR